MNTGRSRSIPTFPTGVDFIVRPTRRIWSIHALRTEGMVKLCMGVPMTITSAASTSSISASETSREPFGGAANVAGDDSATA